jgi:hypothetical protein
MVTKHSLTDDTRDSAVTDIYAATEIVTILQSDPRIPSDARKGLADAAHLLRGAIRKLSTGRV